MTVEEYSVEGVFREMGYKSSTDYAIQKMRDELLHELKVCMTQIDIFEKKYGMGYDEFFRQFNELTQVGLFEREDDIMDWRAELTVLRGVEKRLSRLVK